MRRGTARSPEGDRTGFWDVVLAAVTGGWSSTLRLVVLLLVVVLGVVVVVHLGGGAVGLVGQVVDAISGPEASRGLSPPAAGG